MNVQLGEIKYKIFWIIGIVLSFILYFSGIYGCYIFFRKKVLKQYRTIALTYHRIRDDDRNPDISVSIKNFKRQMVFLKKHFDVTPLDILVSNIGEGKDTKMDNIAITFDDGYKDNYLNAYPILKNHQLPATIFVVTKSVGTDEEMLNADEIRMIKKDGIEFGSHTTTHKVLTETNINTATEEIIHSKEDLENLLKEKIQFFAYPKGKRNHFNEQIKAMVKKSGYTAAFTTVNGEIDNRSDLFALKRIGIRNCPLFVFKVRISGIFESWPIYFIRNILNLT